MYANYSQVSGVCSIGKMQPNAASIALRPGFEVLAHATGCLNAGGDAAPQAFAVAFVKPPPADGNLGGEVQGCPDGICIVGLSAPANSNITAGASQVIKVCGEARRHCTIGVGDWNQDSSHTISDRWHSLVGGPQSQMLEQFGTDHARIVTSIPNIGGSMGIGQGFPLTQEFGNITGQGQAYLVDLLAPCRYPGPSSSGGCLK